MDFLKKSFWTGLSSLAFAAYSFTTNKLFSVYFGPQGVTLLAHFQNLIAIFASITNEGINRGLIKIIAKENIGQREWNNAFTYGLALTFAMFLVVLIFLFSIGFTFYNDFPPELFTPLNLTWLIVAILLHMICLLFISLLMAMQHIKAFTILSVLSNVIGLIFIYIGIEKGIVTSLLYLAASPASMLVIILIYYVNANLSRLKKYTANFEKKAFNQIFQFLLTALASGVMARLVDFYVRSYLIKTFSTYQTGLWQGVAKVSDGYTSVFSAALGILIFTKISSYMEDELKLKLFIRKSVMFTVVITGTGLTFIYHFRYDILSFFYSQEFKGGEHLIGYLLIGDWLKFPSWIFGFVLQAQLKTKTFIATQFASAAVYLLLLWILLPILGLEAMPLAHLLRFVFYLSLMAWLSRKWFM
ncbi:MAG: oligosaccharide flippase family protein [Cytophagales bacterium]